MSVITLGLPGLLRRIRDAVTGPIVLMKGPELATLYPGTGLRPFGDLDLLVDDADAAYRALSGLDFTPEEHLAPDHAHHCTGLHVDGLPLRVEIHRRPNWVPWLTPPPVTELLAAAVPSRLGIAGISTLAPEHHALAVAVHNWRDGPLLDVGQLLDTALLGRECDPDALSRTAEAWGVRRIWGTSSRAAEALFVGEGFSLPLLIGGRHLPRVRDRSIIGAIVSRQVGSLWAQTPARAARALVTTVATDIRPPEGQQWSARPLRVGRILRGALRPLSQYTDLDG